MKVQKNLRHQGTFMEEMRLNDKMEESIENGDSSIETAHREEAGM